MRTLRWGIAAAVAAALALGLVSCGGDNGSGSESSSGSTTAPEVIVQSAGSDFNPVQIYKDVSPGVVTIESIFNSGNDTASILGGGEPAAGQGSGFVIDKDGEIVTNAHVVTSGGQQNGGGTPKEAEQVYVEFADQNRVQADVVGFDPDADVALIKVDPDGLDLKPLKV
jgi:S1-C subfamily serine protease